MGGTADAPTAETAPALDWPGEDLTSKGVRQRRFDLRREGRLVPGMLWTPENAAGPRPLLLLGHGGANTKLAAPVLSLARRVVRHHSFAAAAIDGPIHGDRRADRGVDPTLTMVEFGRLWASDPAMADEMVADWKATLRALRALDEVGEGPVGWWGLSMGTILGVPFVAAEPLVQVAVLGLMGTAAPNPEFRRRFLADARALRCPVLFVMQWDDELMRREHVLELFGELGSPDKRMHAYPGRHVEVPLEEIEANEQFLAGHLTEAPAAL